VNVLGQAKVWLRERGERVAERKAAKRAQQRHGHESRFWLLSIPATATLCAAFVEVYWAILFCIQATGRLDNDWAVAFGTGQAASGAWHFAFDIRSVPVLIGLIAATVPIVMWSMVWLPVQMKARGTGRWRRTTMIVAGLLANALVIVSGTVVMNSNRQEQVRAGQVVEQQAGQGRAQLQTQIDGITADLNTMFNNRNAYMAQAASVGAARWQSTYIAQARATRDERLPMIERALGAAQAADDARARRDALRAQLAAAPTQAAVAAHVEDHAGVGLDTFATYANVYRPPFVALICTIIGIFGTWWWVGLSEAMSRHNISLSGWAPEDHRIEDLRAEEPIAAEPMKPATGKVYDAESGEELVKVKPHWRKLKKGKPQKVDIQPDIPPDETGAENDGGDDGLRSAGAAEPVSDLAQPVSQPASDEQKQDEADQDIQDEALSDDEVAALLVASGEFSEEPPEPVGEASGAVEPEEAQQDEGRGVQEPDDEIHLALPQTAPEQDDYLPEAQEDHASPYADDDAEDGDHGRTPETNPQRLIAAE